MEDQYDIFAGVRSGAGASTTKNTTSKFFKHTSARAVKTFSVVVAALTEQYPNLKLSVFPTYGLNLEGYAAAGHAKITPIDDDVRDGEGHYPPSIAVSHYVPPLKRLGQGSGFIAKRVEFGKFLYEWQGSEFIVYEIHGLEGAAGMVQTSQYYVLSADEGRTQSLALAAGQWTNSLHQEIWVFDGGYWSKSAALYASVMKSSWDAVILDAKMKQDLINDHLSFFQSRDTYGKLKVPWKRGIIYYGPPGNGKTISIKAMMHTLYDLDPEVPTLYVRSLSSFAGPEYSISSIFSKARQFAPCYLVFEDLDSLVSDSVRSYFLNEVDGLKDNDGIFMIGSTNHLERLDPGISKRPSRFDRKYFFPNPNFDERVAYCHFWQSKLKDNDNIKFPDKLCDAIAGITDKFSFAYIQEAFVASLLAIARDERPDDFVSAMDVLTVDAGDDWVEVVDADGGKDRDHDRDGGLDKLVLWVEIKRQVKILRDGLNDDDGEVVNAS